MQLKIPPIRFGTIESTTIDQFALNSATIPAAYDKDLDHLAALLKIYKDAEIHIDSDGAAGLQTDERAGLAHEIGHILLNSGAHPAGTLMTQFQPYPPRLTDPSAPRSTTMPNSRLQSDVLRFGRASQLRGWMDQVAGEWNAP